MKKSEHISDDELRLVAAERATLTPEQQLENHISECEHCQTRLLDLAVDSKWRESIVDSCNELDTNVALEESFLSQVHSGQQSGDPFDLKTSEQMLQEVLEPPTHPEMLGRLGQYDVEAVIGCGGMGVVLRGFDRDLHRPVAIKMVLPRLAKNGTAKRRFAREARAAAVILHPNVIPIYGIDQTKEIPWLAMPLIAGPTLRELVQENGPLPERDIVRIGMQIASGLAAAHSQGVVHRDIKPENILVDNQVNRVVITDFGLARHESDPSMTQTGFLAGTINYMSPEQSRGLTIDWRSDLFSLGGLMFFLATGEEPFLASSAMGVIHAISEKSHVKVQSLNNEVSKTLSVVIDRLLEKDPNDRFQTAADLDSFLSDYLVHLHQPLLANAPELPGNMERAPQGKSRSLFGFHWIASCMAVVLVAMTGWWVSTNWNSLFNVSKDTFPTTSISSADLKTGRLDMWKEIRARYGLEQPEFFPRQLKDLKSEFARIDRWISNPSLLNPSNFEDGLPDLEKRD